MVSPLVSDRRCRTAGLGQTSRQYRTGMHRVIEKLRIFHLPGAMCPEGEICGLESADFPATVLAVLNSVGGGPQRLAIVLVQPFKQ